MIFLVYATAVFLLFNTFLLLLFVEIVLSFYYARIDSATKTLDSRASLEYYQSQPWGQQYWIDFACNESIYAPYLGWIRKDLQTETFNVVDGIRVTPGTSCNVEDSYKVFVLGGSSVYGAGSPDWFTIPAYLQKNFESIIDHPVCTVNLGVSAYVSTQIRIRLEDFLLRGQVPDLVIIYNGPSDVIATLQNRVVGLHHNLPAMADQFNSKNIPQTVLNLKNTHIARFLGIKKKNVIVRQWQAKVPAHDVVKLAHQTIDLYLENTKIITQLAKLYGFDVYFFWQPSIYTTNKVLSQEEQHIRLIDSWKTMFAVVDSLIREKADDFENFHYLTEIFDTIESTIFIDRWHVIPPANELLAQRIFDIIRHDIIAKMN